MNERSDTATPEYLTVRELAALLRIKERKVYDLAASGAVPCSRATGKLLFPEREIRAWIEQTRTGTAAAPRRPAIVLGSHDPLLEWALRQSRCGLATYFDGSFDGLARFRASGGVAAGLHVYDTASGDWNVPAVARDCAGENAALVAFATRRRGLVLAPGTAGIAAPADLRGRRVVPRQPESGTDTLLRELAARDGLDLACVTLTDVARSEADAVQTVARGGADATLGLESLARLFGLAFVPLIDERFDLLVDRAAWFEPPLQTLGAFCRSAALADAAAEMGGYDVSDTGTVRWNA